MRRRLSFRLAAVVLGITAAIGAAELWLRAQHSDLPSLEALDARERALLDAESGMQPLHPALPCTEARRAGEHYDPIPLQRRPGALRVVLSGDSVSRGIGATSQERGVGPRLGALLEARLGRPVDVEMVGSDGGSFCLVAARALHAAAASPPPDAVVVFAFEDDLRVYTVFDFGHQRVAYPDAIQDPLLRGLVFHSYLANRLWFAWTLRQPPLRDARTVAPVFGATFETLWGTLQDRGIPTQIVLLPMAGEADNDGSCDGSAQGVPNLEVMAYALGAGEVPFLDLRGFFAAMDPPPVMPEELERRAAGGACGVHPDDRGHAALAERLADTIAPLLERP